MVLVSCFALILISVYRNRQSEQPADTFRRLWATGVVAFMLSLLADFAPTVAGPFAALTVLGWFVKDGTALVDNALGSGDFSTSSASSPGRGGGGNFSAGDVKSTTTTRPNQSGGKTTQTGP